MAILRLLDRPHQSGLPAPRRHRHRDPGRGTDRAGWEVDDITAYRTVRAAPPAAETREAIKTGGFDAVLFTSSSTVRNLVGIAGKPHATTVVACIGPATAKTAEEHGLRVDVLASDPKIEVLVTEPRSSASSCD